MLWHQTDKLVLLRFLKMYSLLNNATTPCIDKAQNLHRPQAEWILVNDSIQDRNQNFIEWQHTSTLGTMLIDLLCIASAESKFRSTQPQLSHFTTHWLECAAYHQ